MHFKTWVVQGNMDTEIGWGMRNNLMHQESMLCKSSHFIDDIFQAVCPGDGEFNIEEYWSAVDHLEEQLQVEYVRMDFGIPGLRPSKIALEAHGALLREGGVASQYPPYSGVARLNQAFSVFLHRRLGVSVSPEDVFVTCGATQALFVGQAIAARLGPRNGTALVLAPNYPPMNAQARFLGMNVVSLDMDGKRGPKLIRAIRTVFESGNVSALCWASPSNPGWTVLTGDELQEIAKLCKAYDVVPIEDLTYLGMSDDGRAAFPSIAQYSEDYFLVLSSSKMLSYAGERVGFLVVSPHLQERKSVRLESDFGTTSVRRACGSFIFNLTAGAPHSAQYAIAEVFDAINKGAYSLNQSLSVYSKRSAHLASALKKHGFYRIYVPLDGSELNGFYINFGYPGHSEMALVKSLLHVGIAVLPLSIFGSERHDGVRACVGRLDSGMQAELNTRLDTFARQCHG